MLGTIILELVSNSDRGSWDTETAADMLDLNGYAREELCNDAPVLFSDAVARLYQRALDAAAALEWRGWTLRVLAQKLRHEVKG